MAFVLPLVVSAEIRFLDIDWVSVREFFVSVLLRAEIDASWSLAMFLFGCDLWNRNFVPHY